MFLPVLKLAAPAVGELYKSKSDREWIMHLPLGCITPSMECMMVLKYHLPTPPALHCYRYKQKEFLKGHENAVGLKFSIPRHFSKESCKSLKRLK